MTNIGHGHFRTVPASTRLVLIHLFERREPASRIAPTSKVLEDSYMLAKRSASSQPRIGMSTKAVLATNYRAFTHVYFLKRHNIMSEG